MLVFGVILMLIMILLCTFYRKNGFVKIVAFYFLAMSFTILTGTVYLSKSIQPVMEYSLDSRIYNMLYNLRMPYSTIMRGFNASIFAYMIVSVAYIKYIEKLSLKKIFLIIIPCIYIVVTADPILIGRLYPYTFTNNVLSWYLKLNANINRYLLNLYMFVPSIMAFIKASKTKVFVKKRDILLSGLCSMIVNIFMYFFMINGLFRDILFFEYSGVFVPEVTNAQTDLYATILFLWIAVGMVCITILFIRPFWFSEPANKWKTGVFSKRQNQNTSMILHTYKNAFVGINQQFMLAQSNIEKNEYERALRNTELGQNITEEYLDRLNKTLDIFRVPNESFESIDILGCIKKAYKKASIAHKSNIKIDIESEYEEIFVRGNESHLTEMILNLIVNASESIIRKKSKDGRIKIALFCEEELLQINICDNGEGIERRFLNKIFKPFFSTKKRAANGIGLSYVANVVKQHHGHISVRSEYGKYTEFQIVLPIQSGGYKL